MSNVRPNTKDWRDGDPVSLQGTGVTGKVVVLKRQADGKPYVRIQIVAGGAVGRWEWPDRWLLGVGRYELACRSCARRFKSDDRASVMCVACGRDERPDYDPHAASRRTVRVALRGNASPSRPAAPSPAVIVHGESFYDPFSTNETCLCEDGEGRR